MRRLLSHINITHTCFEKGISQLALRFWIEKSHLPVIRDVRRPVFWCMPEILAGVLTRERIFHIGVDGLPML